MASATRLVPASPSRPECCCDYQFEMRVPTIVSFGPVWCAITKLFMADDLFGASIDSSLTVTSSRGLGKLNADASVYTQTSKIVLQSGRWTSTVRDSLAISSPKGGGHGVEWDGTNTPWCGTTNSATSAWGLVLFSGQFSSTVKSSLSFAASAVINVGVTYDSGDTPWIRAQSSPNAAKFYLQSGQFTSTVKTSLVVTLAQTPGASTGSDISDDTPDTIWCTSTGTTPYILRNSGQFTSTVKNSRNVSTQGNAFGISL